MNLVWMNFLLSHDRTAPETFDAPIDRPITFSIVNDFLCGKFYKSILVILKEVTHLHRAVMSASICIAFIMAVW